MSDYYEELLCSSLDDLYDLAGNKLPVAKIVNDVLKVFVAHELTIYESEHVVGVLGRVVQRQCNEMKAANKILAERPPRQAASDRPLESPQNDETTPENAGLP